MNINNLKIMQGTYKFGDIPVEIKYRGKLFEESAKDYLTDEKPKFSILAQDEDLAYEQSHSEENIEYSNPYLEFIALYRLFCEKAIDDDVILFHGSVVEVDGESYLFTAPSGVGKSTHTRMWCEFFGDRAVMINDDKPLLRFDKDTVYAYGTPWDGKHHLSTNKKSPLKAICFLARGRENKIEKADPSEIAGLIMNQIYRPRNAEGMMKTMDYINRLIKLVPMYKMECDISKEAAEMAYKGMK